MDNSWEIENIVEQAIDHAFNRGKFVLNMYDLLKSNKATKRDVEALLESQVAKNITLLIYDLEDYLEGGSDSEHKQLREAYGHLGKPEARKIKQFLEGLLQGAWKYGQEKRPGRKRRTNSK